LQIKPDIRKYIKLNQIDRELIYKYRIVYGINSLYTQIEKYSVKKIESLKVVVDNDIRYDFKYADRDNINVLYSQKDKADDILIVKNEKITDTSFCNIALLNSESWFTPRSPLLNGIMREKLVEQNIISIKDININELDRYSKIALFNAMIPWENKICLSIENIHF
jgi:4-amino-4-deoxychorismate lyase